MSTVDGRSMANDSESFFGRTVGQYDLEYLTNEKYALTLSFLGFFISK